ncbi:MAG: hypothetical protein ABUL55_02645, partial [Pseudomonadota bacterium]
MGLAADALKDVVAPPQTRRPSSNAQQDESGQFADLLPRPARHEDDQQVRQSPKADANPTDVEETAAANEEEPRADEAKAPEPSEPGGAHPHHQPHFMLQLIAAQAQQAIA